MKNSRNRFLSKEKLIEKNNKFMLHFNSTFIVDDLLPID